MKECNKEDFPKRAIYKKPDNVIPFATDFKDCEVVEFGYWCARPNSHREGLAWYYSKRAGFKLVNIDRLERVEE